MNICLNHVIALVPAAGIVWAIHLMNSPRTAVKGNLLGSLCMLGAIILTLTSHAIIGNGLLWLSMAVGGVAGYLLAVNVAMVQMPQLVGLLNGLGGGASAIVAFMVLSGGAEPIGIVGKFTAPLALFVGTVTLSGSGIAVAKLARKIGQRPIVLAGHTTCSVCILVLGAVCIGATTVISRNTTGVMSLFTFLSALSFGLLFAMRVGGADMPIAISLLNSMSGLAASITGFAIGSPLLVMVGAIVGAGGLILTQIMCRAMNRSLIYVLAGKTAITGPNEAASTTGEHEASIRGGTDGQVAEATVAKKPSIASVFQRANRVVIVPGYGMALAQAQHQVSNLIESLETQGKEVRVAIHPVAGRMPGHMNVLLAEAGVPYDKLCEMDDINADFKTTDLVIVVGANDVVNPAAMTAEGTPIYGMPILRINEAEHIIICNKDTQPGYAGVNNPLYRYDNVTLFLGDAAETVAELVGKLDEAKAKRAD